MLIWLDQAQSRKDHPNENFAREVMELFALGEGHYTERDVTEAARALTGWSLDQEAQKFMNRPMIHDTGGKTFLGRNGNLDGTDVIEQIVAQPQAAIFITAKIWNFFTGQPPTPELNRALADVFRSSGNNFKPLLRKMFLSEEFYAPSIMGNQVKSPVQWLVGSVRALECDLPPFAANLVRALGQDLFAPPNVKGWDGGLAWITTSNLLTRYNEAAAIINGGPLGPGPGNPNNPNQAFHLQTQMANAHWGGVDVEKIFTEPERHDQEMLLAALEKRLLLVKLRNRQQSALREFLDGKTALTRADIRGAIRLVMSTPEYQVT